MLIYNVRYVPNSQLQHVLLILTTVEPVFSSQSMEVTGLTA